MDTRIQKQKMVRPAFLKWALGTTWELRSGFYLVALL